MSAMDLFMKSSYLAATTQALAVPESLDTTHCNFVQFGLATMSIFALQLCPIILCNFG